MKKLNSKTLRLREWLTLPEAVKHISSVLNEEITEAEILQFALDGHLKLSVNFVNRTVARRGNIVGSDHIKWGEFPKELFYRVPYLSVEENGESYRHMESLKIDDTRFLNFSDNTESIQGIYDLPMIGCERLDIKRKFHRLTDGPEVAFEFLGGPVVERSDDGVFYQVGFNCYSLLSYGPKTIAQIEKIRKLESSKSNNKRIGRLLALRKEHLKLVKMHEQRLGFGHYLMGHGLPKDSVLVLRTEVLKEFEQLMLNSDAGGNTAAKVHGNTEHNAKKREEVLGAALSVLSRWPDECKNRAGKIEATKIRELIEKKGYMFWRENGEPPLTTSEIEKLIRQWLKKTGE